MPADLEFTLKSCANEELSMLMVIEPIVGDFTPRKDLFVRHSDNTYFGGGHEPKTHWVNHGGRLIGRNDGLCVLHGFSEVTIMSSTSSSVIVKNVQLGKTTSVIPSVMG